MAPTDTSATENAIEAIVRPGENDQELSLTHDRTIPSPARGEPLPLPCSVKARFASSNEGLVVFSM